MMKRTSATQTSATATATTTRRTFVKRVGALAGATLLLGQSTLPAHAESSREVEPSHPSGAGINVLLVHGAYVDASSWSKVIPLLQANGYNTLAVQLPATVAVEVAKTAAAEGLARMPLTDVVQQVQDTMWQPVYPQIQVRQEARV